jgi:hypothetical protein
MLENEARAETRCDALPTGTSARSPTKRRPLLIAVFTGKRSSCPPRGGTIGMLFKLPYRCFGAYGKSSNPGSLAGSYIGSFLCWSRTSPMTTREINGQADRACANGTPAILPQLDFRDIILRWLATRDCTVLTSGITPSLVSGSESELLFPYSFTDSDPL